MIDQRTAARPDRRRGRRPDAAAVLLLDVVLGHGAHPDPAAELAPAIAARVATRATPAATLAVVVSLCGDRRRPAGPRPAGRGAARGRRRRLPVQRRRRPARRRARGEGHAMTALLDRTAAGRQRPASPMFADALADQAVAGRAGSTGGRRSASRAPRPHLARVLADPRRAEANATAVGRLLAAGAELVDVRPGVRGARPRAAARSCTPGRRSAGTARPGRCAAR